MSRGPTVNKAEAIRRARVRLEALLMIIAMAEEQAADERKENSPGVACGIQHLARRALAETGGAPAQPGATWAEEYGPTNGKIDA